MAMGKVDCDQAEVCTDEPVCDSDVHTNCKEEGCDDPRRAGSKRESTVMLRLLIEKLELDKKISKLVIFLSSDHENIGKVQEALLDEQLRYMKLYACCLNLRIQNLKE